MKSYVFVTFAFLGAAFYHLSGGAAYQPQPGSLQAARAQTDAAPDPRIAAATGNPRPQSRSQTRPETRPETRAFSRPQPDRRTPPTQPATLAGVARPTDLPAIVSRSAFVPGLPDQTAVSDAASVERYSLATLRPSDSTSLPQAQAQAGALADAAPPAKDLRAVRKSRVNLRLGPGTQYNVVAKLTAGTSVEVLQDPGNGWVKLRVVDGGRVGWMAQGMISGPN